MTPCVMAAAWTTVLRTAAPRVLADAGSPARAGRGAVHLDTLQDLTIADLNMLPDQVRGHLAPHPQESRDEGRPISPPMMRRGLYGRTEGQRVLRPQMQHGEEHRAGKRKALTHGLYQLRGQGTDLCPSWA